MRHKLSDKQMVYLGDDKWDHMLETCCGIDLRMHIDVSVTRGHNYDCEDCYDAYALQLLADAGER